MRLLFFRSVVAFFLFSFGLSATSNAQYLERRKKYGTMEYSYQAGDPYHPFAAGLGSAILPGMGHLIAGEPKRALGFAAGFYGSVLISAYGISNMAKTNTLLQDKPLGANETFMILGAVSAAIFYFYGIFDAMEVAEINNLAYRFNQKGPYMQLSPGLHNISGQVELQLQLRYVLHH